jgi:hypothetical protein
VKIEIEEILGDGVIALAQTIGRGSGAFVSVVFKVGPVGVENLRQIFYNVQSVLDSIHFGINIVPRITPGAIALDFALESSLETDRACEGLKLLRERLDEIPRAAVEPVKSPADLLDAIVFGAEPFPEVGQDVLKAAPVVVAVTAGRRFDTRPEEGAESVRTRVFDALKPRQDAAPVEFNRSATSDTSVRQRWIQLPQQSSSLVRWYRQLPSVSSRDEALARSIGNACIGGTPSSRIYRVLSEQRRYSYNPSVFLRTVNGQQWMVLDAATATHFEMPVDTEIKRLFATALESPPMESEVRDAAKYMLTQKRMFMESPQLANLSALAAHDGSDPWDLASATPQDLLNITPGLVAEEVRKVYVASDCLRLVVSPNTQPREWDVK